MVEMRMVIEEQRNTKSCLQNQKLEYLQNQFSNTFKIQNADLNYRSINLNILRHCYDAKMTLKSQTVFPDIEFKEFIFFGSFA